MADFRRWITALAVIALFAGLASAQVGGAGATGPLTCTASAPVPPLVRAEGLTELLGDIVITCTGGPTLPNASAIPTANFTVSLAGTNVTSRLLASGGVSEALLLIDEPASGLSAPVAGFGPLAPFNVCTTPFVGAGTGGCQEFVNTGVPAAAGIVPQVAVSAAGAVSPGPNVFQGIVSGNQVTFNGIPILAPVSTGTTRVFRITNIRANIAVLPGGGSPGTTPVNASIAISGSTSLPIQNGFSAVTAGFIQNGLNVSGSSVRNLSGSSATTQTFPQCTSETQAFAGLVRFQENFATAFKTRVVPTTAKSGQDGVTGTVGGGLDVTSGQGTPGHINQSESGLVIPASPGIVPPTIGGAGLVGTNAVAGLADFGTRLKATFTNVPAGVRLFVSTVNLIGGAPAGTAPPAFTSAGPFGQLVITEVAPDSNGFAPVFPNSGFDPGTGKIPIVEIPVTNGTAMAVWEVINTNPAQVENMDFGVFTTFSAGVPTPGTPTVTLSFAPTFTTSAGGSASSSLPIPRFNTSVNSNSFFTLALCQTALLFPFVTTVTGFDTGLAISNTTADSFGTSTTLVVPTGGTGGVGPGLGTTAQPGACSLNFFGSGVADLTKVVNAQLFVSGATSAVALASTGRPACTGTTQPQGCIAAGSTAVTIASNILPPGFTGYMIAVCDFQFAHGFAFISDQGAKNLAMGYLALVMTTTNGLNRGTSSAETFTQ